MFSTKDNTPTPYPIESKPAPEEDPFKKLLREEDVIRDRELLNKMGIFPISPAADIYYRYKSLVFLKEKEEKYFFNIQESCNNVEYGPFLCDSIDGETLEDDKLFYDDQYVMGYLNHAIIMGNNKYALALLDLGMPSNVESVRLYISYWPINYKVLTALFDNFSFSSAVQSVNEFMYVTSFLLNKGRMKYPERVCFVGLNFNKIIVICHSLGVNPHYFVKKYFEDYAKFLLQGDLFKEYEDFAKTYPDAKPDTMVDTLYYLSTCYALPGLHYLIQRDKSDFTEVNLQRTFISGFLTARSEVRALNIIKYFYVEWEFEVCEDYARMFRESDKLVISDYFVELAAREEALAEVFPRFAMNS
jgi:hypothetical protein